MAPHRPHNWQTLIRIAAFLAVLGGCSTAPARQTPLAASSASAKLATYYRAWRGTAYRYGGDDRTGLDCSAFVQNAYRDVFHTALPRTTRQQAKTGQRVYRASLEPGDLVFFKTGWFLRHVGIYTGGGNFIHVSASRGVTRSSLANPYWQQHYWKSVRLLGTS